MKTRMTAIVECILIALVGAACDRGSASAGSEESASANTTSAAENAPATESASTAEPNRPAQASAAAVSGAVSIGTPVQGSFATNLPVDSEGKPYIDYTLTISSAGSYTFDLRSSNTDNYDPFIAVLQGTTVLGSDDDSGDESLQSRLIQSLEPGSYTVRVTRFGAGQIDAATNFTLSVAPPA